MREKKARIREGTIARICEGTNVLACAQHLAELDRLKAVQSTMVPREELRQVEDTLAQHLERLKTRCSTMVSREEVENMVPKQELTRVEETCAQQVPWLFSRILQKMWFLRDSRNSGCAIN